MTDSDVTDALGELYQEGKLRWERPADPDEDMKFSLSEHGRAAARDLLRDNDHAVILVVSLAVSEADGEYNKALAEVAKTIAEDAGINAYRVLDRNIEDVPWLTTDAITENMIDVIDEHFIGGEGGDD